MKIRPGYILRQVMDIYVIVGVGNDTYVPNQIMSVNETGAFLWSILENGAEREELVDKLTKEYDVDADKAAEDVDLFLSQLREKALIIE